ncbi:hypothetical protein BUALT_Bualt06G0025100 [Buddleja alternifolia]|uniref:Protein kinase domain-containing protein n=1 Tax=Buddleja alternifolia TaxID=168488 RepID=A0AAV6XDI9_9LAMI|nr:hypothetical protein BUALT_Bualt06G0025100 [Buddleja alternifolia]
MKCFQFSNANKSDDPKITKSTSGGSCASTSTYQDVRNSGSENNSQSISSDISNASSGKISFASLSQRPTNLRVFTFAELKIATRNFSRSLMLGEGGFGPVYRGVLHETEDSSKRIDIAGHKEWVTEVNVLGIVEHPNLVRLIGYCAEDDERGMQRLLIYEYLANRSVQDHISPRFQTPLPWATRLKVAQDAARGLAYLHEGMEFQIIFRDFKSSNILLDDHGMQSFQILGWRDWGRQMDSAMSPQRCIFICVLWFRIWRVSVVGTVGYAAPEYIQTGRLTSKSDVWSYGIFLYELITGRRPLDRNRPKNEEKLLDWVRPHLADMKKFEQILDPRLNGKYEIKSAQKLAAIANKCLVRHPKNRPRMSEVLEMVNNVVEALNVESPESSVMRDEDEKCSEESLRRRIIDHIIGDAKCLGGRSWRPAVKTI